MIDPKEVRENLDEWLQNPSWKEVYDDAPSEACRKYIAMMFYASETEEDEAFAALDELEADLSPEDCRYMFSFTEGPEKAKWARKMAGK